MSEPLFVEERRRAILDELRKFGRVSVKSLSEAMNVSTVTIRQDLRMLEESGLLERTYGGAVSVQSDNLKPELSFHVRQNRHPGGKSAIAAAAAALVQDGFSIALDASTTAYAMVPFLKEFTKLTILTNSLVVAQSFLDAPRINVLVPGGRIRVESISIVGRLEGLPDINLNIGFMGARGITLSEGITDVDSDEAMIKQAMAARCVSNVVVADGSKWGQVAPYTVIKPTQVDRIITTVDAPTDLVRQFRNSGIRVDLVAATK
jgi:DeoR/GlpR family transcriptional regulator of sugar metabolism